MQTSGDGTEGVTRHPSEQRIAEYTNAKGVGKPFFLKPGARMAQNRSVNAIQMIEKRGTKGTVIGGGRPRARALKQASLKSSLLTRPITSSTKPSRQYGASNTTFTRPRDRSHRSPSSTGKYSVRSPSKMNITEDEDEVFHKPKQQCRYQCALRACKCWKRLKKSRLTHSQALEDYEDESGEYVAGIARSSHEITVTDSVTDHMVLGGRVVSKADDVESDATCAVRKAGQVRIEPSKDTNETANLVIKTISSSKPVPQ